MVEVRRMLLQRMQHIVAYLRTLQFIESSGGPVSIQGRGESAMIISLGTIHVMKAGVFLHMYNLVESTVTLCLERLADQIKTDKVAFRDLDDCWRRVWASGHVLGKQRGEELGPEKRLAGALSLCQTISDELAFNIKPKIPVGSLDDQRIEDVAKKYGVALRISAPVLKSIKKPVTAKSGFLALVRQRRNNLAHGTDSFADAGKDYTTAELVRWSWSTYQYLKEVVASFQDYLSAQRFRRQPPAASGS